MKFFIFLTIISIVLLSSCSVPKWAKPEKVERKAPINAKERARQNVNEGRGISITDAFKEARQTMNLVHLILVEARLKL